jgi:hypothetical protein
MLFPIERTPDNKPAIGIGGGSFTKKFTFRTVIRNTGDRFELKPAIFIRSAGDLACQLDQGIAEIEPGDLIVIGSGFLPITKDNPGVNLAAFRVITLGVDHALVSEEKIAIGDLPFSIITGASLYHNRDGSYFAGVSS